MQITRNKIAMLMAEFLGTGVLTLVVLAAGKSIGYAYFVALGVGLALAGLAMVLGPVSGAHLNPAVTFGLWTVRKIKLLPAVVYIAVQFLGGFVAYALFTYFMNSDVPASKAAFDGRVLMGEAVGAFVFSLGWAATVYQKMEGAKAAATVGISLALGALVASLASRGILNPAVALGVRSWVWGTYALGPILGAIIGFNLYALLFAPAGDMVEGTVSKKKR